MLKTLIFWVEFIKLIFLIVKALYEGKFSQDSIRSFLFKIATDEGSGVRGQGSEVS